MICTLRVQMYISSLDLILLQISTTSTRICSFSFGIFHPKSASIPFTYRKWLHLRRIPTYSMSIREENKFWFFVSYWTLQFISRSSSKFYNFESQNVRWTDTSPSSFERRNVSQSWWNYFSRTKWRKKKYVARDSTEWVWPWMICTHSRQYIWAKMSFIILYRIEHSDNKQTYSWVRRHRPFDMLYNDKALGFRWQWPQTMN